MEAKKILSELGKIAEKDSKGGFPIGGKARQLETRETSRKVAEYLWVGSGEQFQRHWWGLLSDIFSHCLPFEDVEKWKSLMKNKFYERLFGQFFGNPKSSHSPAFVWAKPGYRSTRVSSMRQLVSLDAKERVCMPRAMKRSSTVHKFQMKFGENLSCPRLEFDLKDLKDSLHCHSDRICAEQNIIHVNRRRSVVFGSNLETEYFIKEQNLGLGVNNADDFESYYKTGRYPAIDDFRRQDGDDVYFNFQVMMLGRLVEGEMVHQVVVPLSPGDASIVDFNTVERDFLVFLHHYQVANLFQECMLVG